MIAVTLLFGYDFRNRGQPETTMNPSASADPNPRPVVVNTGPAAVADAAGSFITRMAHFTPQQAQTASVLVLILFVCSMMGYQFFMAHNAQAETLALMIRSMESESEKNRTTTQMEFERNRNNFANEAKANREAFAENTKLTIASHQRLSTELGKLEQVVTTLSTSISDLRKKIPPHEDEVVAPHPRLKVLRDAEPNIP